MCCGQKSTKPEATGCACPCAKVCSKKAFLLAIAAVPLALWAIKRLGR